jgi:chromosome segregation ATPase
MPGPARPGRKKSKEMKKELRKNLERANMSLRVAQGKIQAAKELVEENKTALQEFFDSHSERWQESDAASDVEEKIDELDDIASELDGAYDALDSQIGYITEAMG